MIPFKLSTNVCSLIKGEPRLALSIMFTMDEEGMIDESSIKVQKSVVINQYKLNYEGRGAKVRCSPRGRAT